MKICIPTNGKGGLDDMVCEHFGSAPTFTIVETDSGNVEVVQNASDHFGGTGKPPEQVAKTGAKIVVCSGLGPRAITLLRSFGIDAFIGAEGRASDAFKMWSEGRLRPATMESACAGHQHDHHR